VRFGDVKRLHDQLKRDRTRARTPIGPKAILELLDIQTTDQDIKKKIFNAVSFRLISL